MSTCLKYYALIVSAVAYRDAIDRILSIPLSEMIGIPLQGKSPHAEDGGPGIDPDEDLPLPIDADSESDVQLEGTSCDSFFHTSRSSGSASHLFPMDNNDNRQIYNNHLSRRMSQPSSPDHSSMVTSHESPLRSTEADGLHGSWVDDSGYADMDTTEPRNLPGTILTHDLLDPQRYPSPPLNSFPFSFGSHSQGTEEYILDMDTSPPSSQGSFSQLRGGWSSNHEHFLRQSSSSSTSPIVSPAPVVTHDYPESFGWDSSIKCDSPISQSLCHMSDVKQTSASSFQTQCALITPQKAQKMLYTAKTSEAVVKSFDDISITRHRRPFQPPYSATRTEPVESHSFNSSHRFSSFGGSDTHDPGLPLDILNDPDPWATIGKILNLEVVKVRNNDDITFTRGREGVGYVRHRLDETAHIWNLPRNSTISLRSIKSESDYQPKATMNDEVEERLGETTDHCRHHSQHSEGSQSEERPSSDHSNLAKDMKLTAQNEPLCTLTVAEPEMQTESPCIPTALSHRVSPQDVQCGRIDDDDMYGGPCLFGDSDEEDE
ncbi:uncharacterized protein BJ212DRAFT_980037 [Suillus subaureus]|uniref:Uncharacterized protein n=1 Tax=Suillus subaureus TaxID=48587 RepID=A0A9P7JGR7_9AGAM|nr:uncharacterized protein BJ212DRAFT_980037 [Suillus subaureus]KAG1821114.1 hypothetical protein BJ212DRAFT_980037 [Suillus subaureus]